MYFNVEKLIYPVKNPCKLTFISNMPVSLDNSGEYRLNVFPFSGLRLKELNVEQRAEVLSIPLKDIAVEQQGESLTATVVFPQEDRYVLRLLLNGKEIDVMEVYALEEDLFERTPYKGDTHLHSFLSSHGKSGGNESPEYVAAACRWRGYDFVAITDHHEYAPSQRCRAFYKPLETDYLLMSGEEVHSPGNPVHIVSLGGTSSVNEWAEGNIDEYKAAVAAKMQEVTDRISDTDRFTVAACKVVFDKIREYNGVSILCHPSWIRGTTKLINEPQDVTDTLFESPDFDAYELLAGGAYAEGSYTQVSYCMGRTARPAMGCSDSHATSRMPLSLDSGYYSIVFAKDLTEASVLEAIKEGMCISACQDRLIGTYRLVKFAYFAMKYIYPKHDKLCEKQGSVFMKLTSGRDSDDFLLPQLDGIRTSPTDYYKSVKA